MEKKQVLVNFIERVIFLLAGVQVLLGLVWIAGNITYVPGFSESGLYLQASRDFVVDEYMGILYPLLIRMASVAGNRFCVVLYLVQLSVAFVAYNYFIANVFGGRLAQRKWVRYLLAAYVVTFPVILQVHMCVLPYSLASSMLVILLAKLRKLLMETGSMSARTVVSIGVFWSIGALLLPDYGMMAGIVTAVGFVICGWKRKRRWRVLLLTAFVTITCVSTTLALTQTPGSLGRIQKSMGATMLSRLAWPYMERNSFFWGEEVKVVFSADDLRGLSLYPERILYEFGPRLEAEIGKERANAMYWEMAVDSFGIGKKEALTAIGRDLLQNISGPAGVQLQWQGIGVSYAGWNYARMAEHVPILTKHYVRFTSYSYDFMLLLAVVVWWMQRKRYRDLSDRTYLGLVILAVLVVTFWYTMICNGMQDYMKVIPTNILWCMIPVWGCMQCMKYAKKD